MRKDSHLERFNLFASAAALAGHAGNPEGFRQRDFKFLVEMFSNFIDMTLNEKTLTIHNTQIMRFLNELFDEGYAKRSSRGSQPSYRMTAVGIVQILSKLSQRPPQFPLEHFYFVFHFLETYREPLKGILAHEGKNFPPTLRIEFDSLLDTKKLLDTHIQFLEGELKKIRQRILDSENVTKLTRQMRAQKKITKDIVAAIEAAYPYDLNSQKPLSKFYESIPPQFHDFIIDFALPRRAPQMWIPIENSLNAHLENLKSLKGSATSSKKVTA